MGTVKYSDEYLPKVSEKDWMELRDRAGRVTDDKIDYSDAPATEDFSAFKRWNDPALWRPIKKDIHIKIDADILAWLKSSGKGYQTRINAILRNAMTTRREVVQN
ncbi:hypothetical protein AGMMS49546_34670 [Spirochaetia bacterium]|nr:hypothetical protein AGMMS49546_34670 [Spirochaetia bacterium]